MTTIEEIKEAVAQLSSDDLAVFRTWFAEFDWQVWDEQLERDVASGRLDILADEALQDFSQGRTNPL
ncbi:MAG: hypothetical protein FJ316_02865 [SAR202 cluster bacterium]|nr:hypothetical protein [SAR202 cluster bacterium]